MVERRLLLLIGALGVAEALRSAPRSGVRSLRGAPRPGVLRSARLHRGAAVAAATVPQAAEAAAGAAGAPAGTLGAWLPVGSVDALSTLGPTRVEIASRKYVVWEHEGAWSVLSDACPHRLAPLSQGHVDPKTGCIECPYHGWQFDAGGACTRVPQSPKGASVGSPAGGVRTAVVGDILWARLHGLGDALGARAGGEGEADSPLELWPALANLSSTTVRELPYSLDFLVENFMDPAHVPFAHHGLQGVRTDGSPVPMALLQSTPALLEVSFADTIKGKGREGIASFRLPCIYHFRTKGADGQFGIRLVILTVPVRPGLSRAFVSVVGRAAPKWFPKWLSHALSNRFLDTDAWLHDAERWARGTAASAPLGAAGVPGGLLGDAVGADGLRGLPYKMPTSSDAGARFFRQWWARTGVAACVGYGPAAPSELRWESRADQFDRFGAHAASCRHCQLALRRWKQARAASPLAALLPLALGLPVPARLGGVALWWGLRALSAKAVVAIEGAQAASDLSARVIVADDE